MSNDLTKWNMCSLLVWWSIISPSPCWPAYNQNSTCPRNSHIPEITNKWTSLNFLKLWVQSHIKEETYGESDTEVKVTMIVKVKSKRHKLLSIFLLMKSQCKRYLHWVKNCRYSKDKQQTFTIHTWWSTSNSGPLKYLEATRTLYSCPGW